MSKRVRRDSDEAAQEQEAPMKRSRVVRSESTVAFLQKTFPATRHAVAHTNAQSDTFEMSGAEVYLPLEVFVLFFGRLSARDLKSSACVCLNWHKASLQPQLTWVDLFSGNELELHDTASWSYSLAGYPFAATTLAQHGNYGFGHRGSLRETVKTELAPYLARKVTALRAKEAEPETQQQRNYGYMKSGRLFELLDPKNEVAGYAALVIKDLNSPTGPKGWEDLAEMLQLPSVWNVILTESEGAPSSGYWGADTTPDRVWKVSISVNVFMFEKLFETGQHVPGQGFVSLFLARSAAKEFAEKLPGNSAHIPEGFSEPTLQPDGLSIKLHKYQLCALKWMTSVERETTVGVKYCLLYPARSLRSNLLADFVNDKLYRAEDPGVDENVFKLTWRGGILADEMGLGKTMTVVSLILNNPASNVKNTSKKTGTKATLVICPSHLVKQWVDEVQGKASKLKVISISTIVNLRHFETKDFQEADVVVVSANVLKGDNYQKVRDGQAGSKAGPIFQDFMWHRVVLDEAHEFVQDTEFMNCAVLGDSAIVGSFKWYVTGSPFPNEAALRGIFDFLDFESTDPTFAFESSGRNHWATPQVRAFQSYQRWVLGDFLTMNLYWRNTKKSVSSESSIPDYREEIRLLDFHPVERALYDEAGVDERRYALCAHAQVSLVDRNVFGEKAQNLEQLRKNKIANLKSKIVELKDRKKDLAASLADLRDRQAKGGVLAPSVWHVEHTAKRLKETDESLEATQKSLENFQLLEPVEAPESGLVEEPEKKGKPTKGSNSLPTPVAKMTIKQLQNALKKRELPVDGTKAALTTRLADVVKKEDLDLVNESVSKPQESIQSLVFKHGTKLGNLLHYMQHEWTKDIESRFILFSAHSQFLYLVSTMLDNLGIANVWVEGNVHNRNKAISSFKADDLRVRVIMLSLESAASGTNLMEATHVVLLDPTRGTKEEARAVEGQAIGRAHRQGQKNQVTIARFVVKNTIEHKQHVATYDPNQVGKAQEVGVISRKGSLLRTTSLAVMLANDTDLRSSGTLQKFTSSHATMH